MTKIKFFRSVRFNNDWELNFIGSRYNLRIGRSQLAFWRDYNPVFDWHVGCACRLSLPSHALRIFWAIGASLVTCSIIAISIALCIALSSCQSYQPPGQDLYKALQYTTP